MSFADPKSWLTDIGVATSRPAAFVVFLIYGVAWITLGNGLEWHSFATLATWGMTLVIQRAEHRDTQAIHAKLDELLRVNDDARNQLVTLDEREPEQVEEFRKKTQNGNGE